MTLNTYGEAIKGLSITAALFKSCLEIQIHERGAHLRFVKFLVPKVSESFVLGHNVESQEVAQARPGPELAGALETILELAAL